MVDYYLGHGTYDTDGKPIGIIGRSTPVHEALPAGDVPKDDAAVQAAFAKLRAGHIPTTEPDDPEHRAVVANVVDSLVDLL